MRVLPIHMLLVVVALLLAWLQYKLWLGNGGHHEVAALHAQVGAQQAENLRLQQRNDALAAEVENLKSGEAAVEERARSELGMVKPGETFYRVIEGAGAATRMPAPVSTAPVAEPRQ